LNYNLTYIKQVINSFTGKGSSPSDSFTFETNNLFSVINLYKPRMADHKI